MIKIPIEGERMMEIQTKTRTQYRLLESLRCSSQVGLDGHVGKRPAACWDGSIDGVDGYRVRNVFRLGVALAYTCLFAGLGQCIIARIEILAVLVTEKTLGEDWDMAAVFLLEFGGLFGHHTVVAAAHVLILLALHGMCVCVWVCGECERE